GHPYAKSLARRSGLLTAAGFKSSGSIRRQLAPNFGDFLDLPAMTLSRRIPSERLTLIGLLAVFLHSVHARPLAPWGLGDGRVLPLSAHPVEPRCQKTGG